LPSTNDAPDHPADPGPTPAASSSAPVLGVGQGTQSAFVSLNLIYPIRCPTDGVHFNLPCSLMKTPVLSIAIPTYNRASLLHLCLGRILDEAAPFGSDVEVLVSDNASTDDTKEVISAYRQKHPQLRCIANDTNRGPDFNIARCFTTATGHYVWVFSDDDVLLSGTLARLVPLLRRNEFGIIALLPTFYRQSIEQEMVAIQPFSYEIYQSPHDLAADRHFWLTYITGIITNRRAAGEPPSSNQYNKTFLIQLSWVLPALFSRYPSVKITSSQILGRALEVLDFKLFDVFGKSYPAVLERLYKAGVVPASAKEMLIERIITDYFPHYLRPEYRPTHDEVPWLVLLTSFGFRRSFWIRLAPLLFRRFTAYLKATFLRPIKARILALGSRPAC
jgi:abequosyltransferase